LPNNPVDLIFPPEAIPGLRDERGTHWKALVTELAEADPLQPELVAFVLTMARLNNCATCNADSFRALQGCSQCSRQSLKRYRGTDEQLLRLFKTAKDDVLQHLQSQTENI
jgi:hypothetical protein